MKQKIEVSLSSLIVLRIMLSGIFISAGIGHLLHPQNIAKRIENTPHEWISMFGSFEFMAIASGVVLLIAGILFLIGIYTQWSAWILFLSLIPITFIIQMNNGVLHGPLWKNIAIFGGLIVFMTNKNLDQFNHLIFNKYKNEKS